MNSAHNGFPKAGWTTLSFGSLSGRATAVLSTVGLLIALFIATQPIRYAAAGIIASTVLLIALVRPEIGLALVFFSVPFGSLAEIPLGGLSFSATEGLVGLVLFAWVLRMAADREARISLPPLFAPFGFLLATLALSVGVALSVRLGVKEFLKWSEAFALMIAAANILRRPNQVAWLTGALLLAGALSAAQGWYQFFFRDGPPGFLIAERFLRAYGTFGQPNPYAGYLNLVLPIAFAIVLVGLTRRWGKGLPSPNNGAAEPLAPKDRVVFSEPRQQSPARSFRMRALRTPVSTGLTAMLIRTVGVPILVAGTSFVALAGAEAMSLSRAGWFGLTAGLLAIMALRSRHTLVALLVCLVVLLLVALLGALDLLPATVTERIAVLGDNFRIFDIHEVDLTPENWSIVERMATWQAAWDMFQTSPWYGVGPGGFQSLWPQFGDLSWVLRGSDPPHAHNYYLNSLAETGIVGLTGYLVFLGAAFVYTIGRIRGALRRNFGSAGPLSDPVALSLGGLGVLLALSVHNLFDNIYVHGMTAQVGLTLGLVEAAWRATAGYVKGAED